MNEEKEKKGGIQLTQRFDDLPVKTIKLMEVKAKDGIYIRISPDTILISGENEFKLYDLRSHSKDLSSSYKSLYSMIEFMVETVKSFENVGIDGMSDEIIGFTTCLNMPMNLDMSGHPTILPEEKLYFFQRILVACKSPTSYPGFLALAQTKFVWIHELKIRMF